jgi:CRP-like cAMP-binding protein
MRPEVKSVTDVVTVPSFPLESETEQQAKTDEVATPPPADALFSAPFPSAPAPPPEEPPVAEPPPPEPPAPEPEAAAPDVAMPGADELAEALNSVDRTTHVDNQEALARSIADEVAEERARAAVPDATATQPEQFEQDSSPTPLAQEAPASMPLMPSKDLDVESIEAFADLPDDLREALGKAADVVALREGEQVVKFALAIVLSGSVDVGARDGDVAARINEGQVLYAKATIDAEIPPLRLVGASQIAEVAFWQWADVEKAMSGCPWVEDELRAAADPVLALVGVAHGPFGARLDATIRGLVTMHLGVAAHSEGEVIASKGKQVPGLFVVGAGQIELVEGNDVKGVLGPGEFLFPAQVLGGGVCKADARAAAGGTLVLSCDRHATQELLMTCPPLLEILASF